MGYTAELVSGDRPQGVHLGIDLVPCWALWPQSRKSFIPTRSTSELSMYFCAFLDSAQVERYYFSRAFYSVVDESDLLSSRVCSLFRVRKRIRQEGFSSLLIFKERGGKIYFSPLWNLVDCKQRECSLCTVCYNLTCLVREIPHTCLLIRGRWKYYFFICAKLRKFIVLEICL